MAGAITPDILITAVGTLATVVTVVLTGRSNKRADTSDAHASGVDEGTVAAKVTAQEKALEVLREDMRGMETRIREDIKGLKDDLRADFKELSNRLPVR